MQKILRIVMYKYQLYFFLFYWLRPRYIYILLTMCVSNQSHAIHTCSLFWRYIGQYINLPTLVCVNPVKCAACFLCSMLVTLQKIYIFILRNVHSIVPSYRTSSFYFCGIAQDPGNIRWWRNSCNDKVLDVIATCCGTYYWRVIFCDWSWVMIAI